MSMSQMNLDFDDDDDYETDTVSSVEVPLCPNPIGPRHLTTTLLFPESFSFVASHWYVFCSLVCLLRLLLFHVFPSFLT